MCLFHPTELKLEFNNINILTTEIHSIATKQHLILHLVL